MLAAVSDLASILAIVNLHLLLLRSSLWLAALTYVPALILIARMLRALEVLVHEGSHYNWTRRRRRNDALVNALAALPVFQTVQGYRIAHAWHHRHLGRRDDPCLVRAVEFGWNRLSRASAREYIRGMTAALPRYMLNWWWMVGGNRRALIHGAAWHGTWIILPLAGLTHLGYGTEAPTSVVLAVTAWLAYLGIAFATMLPVLRYMGEAAEHDYTTGNTTRSGTFSNVGPVHWILHPHGDGYHFLHHVDASIPHHRLRAAHRWLSRHDTEYASSRRRKHLLDGALSTQTETSVPGPAHPLGCRGATGSKHPTVAHPKDGRG